MIDLSQDIHSLSDFKRRTSDFMTQMKESGRPVVLTVNGKAELVVQDAASYQELLERAAQVEMLEFLRKSREEIDAGRAVPMRAAIEALGKSKKRK